MKIWKRLERMRRRMTDKMKKKNKEEIEVLNIEIASDTENVIFIDLGRKDQRMIKMCFIS